MEWIDAKDRVPPLGKIVYAYGAVNAPNGYGVDKAVYDEYYGGKYTWYDEEGYLFLDVRCWIEMPPVPEKFNKI